MSAKVVPFPRSVYEDVCREHEAQQMLLCYEANDILKAGGTLSEEHEQAVLAQIEKWRAQHTSSHLPDSPL